MRYCAFCGTELTTGGCPKWDCPSRAQPLYTLPIAPTLVDAVPAGEATRDERRLAENYNRTTHKNVRLIGEGELAYCDDCHGGEVELWEASCEVRRTLRHEATPLLPTRAVVEERVDGYGLCRWNDGADGVGPSEESVAARSALLALIPTTETRDNG